MRWISNERMPSSFSTPGTQAGTMPRSSPHSSIGLARRMTGSRIFAHDTSASARMLAAQLAAANGVSDRVILGEVRSEEAFDMLQAMNTGHEGSMATVHANTPRDALTRLENMAGYGGASITQDAMRHQISSAVNAVLQIARLNDGRRKLVSLSEITGMVEKPKPEEAPSTLALIGRYVLLPEVFDHLDRHEAGAGGEIAGRIPRLVITLAVIGQALTPEVVARAGGAIEKEGAQYQGQ